VRGTRLVEVGLIVLIAVTAVGGVWLLAQPKPPPTGLIVSASPGTASVVPSANLSASPAATVPARVRVVDAFWKLVEAPGPSYHLSGSGRSSAPGFRSSFTLELDVARDDYAGRVNTIGGSGRARIIRKSGVVYAKVDSATWHRRRTESAILRQFPFMGLDGRNDLEYRASFRERGRTLHRLVTTRYYNPSVGRMLDLSAFRAVPSLVRLELVVTDAGRPVRATFRCEAFVGPNGKPAFVGKATYRFTEWGRHFTIRRPTT
jgi:hypothetical protein